MTWLSKNTTIPLPEVIAYDDFTDNPAHPWGGIGGLTLDDQGEVQLGTVVDETFWQVPDIEALWPEGETVASLNIGGSYKTYVEYMVAHVNKYIRLIQIHEKLAFMRDTIPRLEAFVAALPKHADQLNNVKLRLAHKDSHFTNMISDPLPGKITGILDREFAGVVPYLNGTQEAPFSGIGPTPWNRWMKSTGRWKSSSSVPRRRAASYSRRRSTHRHCRRTCSERLTSCG
ncbi:hypothetical protein BFJ66_g14590 [Fusarium oxysporum f. sp. cepae]|uniref:Aminoglycoside phosphotransferase domain-containing protein n=1 Tax=Fusarium oxysporum f. sp. cepae TaxID=396571 RepID=A0A3L6N8Q9_FUSOX|nr:hypothetical protein BFJ65_g12433 [Fusarium oxysporum f. sp. cepae]RKK32476.1 hypothetical protein BFJ67_g14734 [Fusarium oxysporum f. sp. cepae]RKK34110.1 hypothetical protein BFJ66_g14590 [Fusarium oxysporum f. sp. cepae]